MNTRFFLGANSGSGFYSLYDDFAHGEGDFLYLIKGGPGGGKSGFLKKVAQKAESLHYDVEYILCSGDPDSLDGVYIPALHCGLTDATAPHAAEPRRFGYDSCYVNLGQFCSRSSDDRIAEYHEKYKRMYRAAYSYLAAAAELESAGIPYLFGKNDILRAENRAKAAVSRHCVKKHPTHAPQVTRRFIRCIGCRGELLLEDSISALCKQIFLVDDRCGLAEAFFHRAAKEASLLGYDAILCPSPLCPSKTDALLLPEASLGFVSASAAPGLEARHIRLDALVPPDAMREHREELKGREKLTAELKNSAVSYLRRAKEYHDRLEKAYRPFVDFAALDIFTGDFIEKLFS